MAGKNGIFIGIDFIRFLPVFFIFFAEYISAYNELFIRQGKKYILDTTAEMRVSVH